LAEGRWHFQHGPIDLIIDVDGDAATVQQALNASWERFQCVLPELVEELRELRRPVDEGPRLSGVVAQRMLRACLPFATHRFITPMAAVAGAVADELITCFKLPGIRRAFINNGGDIALHLTHAQTYRVGICSNLEKVTVEGRALHALDSVFLISHATPGRGVATSGWRGRSFSMGIADSVTVIARDAAAADAAATLIANAVNCEYAGIVRRPANQLKDDTDLGCRLVTVDVPPLSESLVTAALESGRVEAEYWRSQGLIYAAALFLQSQVVAVLPPSELRGPGAQIGFERIAV
jgi:ApbE superfamily uncharacterized protein (UPF0280 family)